MSVVKKNLLVELFVEELPPKALKKLGESFASVLADGLEVQGLAGTDSIVSAFASPRRLAVHVSDIAARAADKAVSHKLMPASVGLGADGRATPALLKKLAALGIDATVLPTLKRQIDGKAETLFVDSTVEGATLAQGLQKAVDDAIAKLPIPKVMQYQLDDGWTSVKFVRPAHGLVALHGGDVVPIDVLGLRAGRTTQGHRFEAAKPVIDLRDADSYADQLRDDGAVIASFDERRAEIVRQLQAAAAKQGLKPIDDDALLDAAGKLTHQFLIVSNIRPADASRVIEGNERVVRPRLADAKFFFDQDRKRPLASRVAGLAKVVYHNKLGTQGERVERVRSLARTIAQQLGDDALAQRADQAAMLAKADLLTDMVGEFPELQGVMGGYYAKHDGLADDIAFAIEDHYKPRFAGDELPRNTTGVAVALADKLETLAGLFGIGQVPTGDKDPFALRRHALGVIRLLIERELPLDAQQLIADAFKAFPSTHGQAQAEVAFFLRERLSGYLREAGYSVQEVEAAIEARPAQWREFPKRLAAVRAFVALPEAASLAAANKRVGNILKKSDVGFEAKVDAALLNEPAEAALSEALVAVKPRADAAFERGDYSASLQALAALKAPVDAFFDSVMVNADDPALRANRLGLLATLHAAMNRVADLSKLVT